MRKFLLVLVTMVLATSCYTVHLPAGDSAVSRGIKNLAAYGTSNPAAVFGTGMSANDMDSLYQKSLGAGWTNAITKLQARVCYPAIPSGAYPRALYNSDGEIIGSDVGANCTYWVTIGLHVNGNPGNSFGYNVPQVVIHPGEVFTVYTQVFGRGTTGADINIGIPEGGVDATIYSAANSASNGSGTTYQNW